MNEELEKAIFGIISSSGESKSISLAAIDLAKNGKINEAKEKLQESLKVRKIAQESHSVLVQQEAQSMIENNEKVKGNTNFSLSLLLVHAEDQMMSSEVIEIMAKEMIDLYEKLNNK